MSMDKVIVIGCPGAGKSVFSKELQKITDLPLYHLDNIWHKPDKTTIDRDEFDKKLHEIMRCKYWIMDGNYMRTMPERMQACDTVIFLDFPLDVCLKGAESRVGIEHDDLPFVEESFDPEFRKYILDFPKAAIPRIYELLKQHLADKTIWICKSREEAAALLHHFKRDALAEKAAELLGIYESESFKNRDWSKKCDALYVWSLDGGGKSILLNIDGEYLLSKNGESREELERAFLEGPRDTWPMEIKQSESEPEQAQEAKPASAQKRVVKKKATRTVRKKKVINGE